MLEQSCLKFIFKLFLILIYILKIKLMMEGLYMYFTVTIMIILVLVRIKKWFEGRQITVGVEEELKDTKDDKSLKDQPKQIKDMTMRQQKEIVDQLSQDKKKKKKKNRQESGQLMSIKQLQQKYSNIFYGALSLKYNNSMTLIDAIALKNSKLLFSTSKNELVLYDLKRWKKGATCQDRFHVSLDNNNGTAIAIGTNYYYVALKFDKTISYYEFKGGQNGVYFKQVKKFSRNLYKTNLNSLYVNQQQTFIAGTGSQNDTQIYIWSMNGQKLTQVNTCQIQHYDTKFGLNKMIIRGWTTSVKKYSFSTNKEHQFVKLQVNHSLNHAQKAQCSAIDNMGLYSITISGNCGDNELVKIWRVSQDDNINEKTADALKLDIEKIIYCSIHTLRDENYRLKTIVALGNDHKVVICDRNLKVIDSIVGIYVEGLYMTGTMKNIVLGTHLKGGKFIIWNIKPLIEKIDEYTL